MGKRCEITRFFGEYRWLSNFWPCVVVLDGVEYPSVENAYQAAKTTSPSERVVFETCAAGQSKRLGKSVTLRADWDDVKVSIMKYLIAQKFSNPELAEKLAKTGDADIIEGNNWGDTFWGVCNGKGLNTLGHLIMDQRDRQTILLM